MKNMKGLAAPVKRVTLALTVLKYHARLGLGAYSVPDQ